MDAPPSPPPSIPIQADAYLAFCCPIDQASVQRAIQTLALVSQNAVAQRAHLLFQSMGGTVGDGICLYNFFRTFPKPLTIYNAGCVQSIAVVAYLGAKTRIVSKSATFMLHRTMRNFPTPPGVKELKSTIDSLDMDDKRTELILRDHITITADQWANLSNHEFWLGADDAVKIGIATGIGDFAPPIGNPIYYI